MSAYIARRILLMIPTLLGILFVSFVVVQFAPGGPVERVIAQLSGADTGGTSRISGRRRRFRRARPGRRLPAMRSVRNIAARRGSIPDFIKSLEKQFGFDKPAPERFALMVWNFARFDFGKSYFRDVSVLQLIKEKLPVSMSLGHLDDAADLSDLDPARHPQGGEGRLAVRHLDLGRDHRRLCDPGLPVRDPADHPVRRRLVLQYLPAARPDLGRLVAISLVLEDPRLFLAHHAAADLDGARRLRHHDAADQELVPRRNPQAICA